jgi:hypothetical protein
MTGSSVITHQPVLCSIIIRIFTEGQHLGPPLEELPPIYPKKKGVQ